MKKKKPIDFLKKGRKVRALQSQKMEEISAIWQGFAEDEEEIPTDVLGSYRGTSEPKGETPTQDADDL